MGDEDREDMDAGKYNLQNITSFKYLVVALTGNGENNQEISKKILQGKRAI